MTEITAGQQRLIRTDEEAFTAVFTAYADKLTRYLYGRLPRPDWHLAEDLAQDAFTELLTSYTLRGRELDARVWGLLTLIGRRVASHHHRRRSASERPADFSDTESAWRLPKTAAAEDEALANVTVLAMVTEPAPALEAVAA